MQIRSLHTYCDEHPHSNSSGENFCFRSFSRHTSSAPCDISGQNQRAKLRTRMSAAVLPGLIESRTIDPTGTSTSSPSTTGTRAALGRRRAKAASSTARPSPASRQTSGAG